MRILAILLVICLSACSNSKKATKSLTTSEVDYITLQRTGCYGTCPIYSVKIYGDGDVEYEGKRHVDSIGIYEGIMSKESLILIFSYVRKLDWKSYPEAFPIDNVDFPQFHLNYGKENESYKVKANSRADEELIALSKLIDELIKDVNWTQVE